MKNFIFSHFLSINSKIISPNVLAVTDVFLFAIRKLRKQFLANKKMWRNKTPQRAQARLVFCVARAARKGGDAVTVLLSAVIFAFYNK
jgi:hypothetical protein